MLSRKMNSIFNLHLVYFPTKQKVNVVSASDENQEQKPKQTQN